MVLVHEYQYYRNEIQIEEIPTVELLVLLGSCLGPPAGCRYVCRTAPAVCLHLVLLEIEAATLQTTIPFAARQPGRCGATPAQLSQPAKRKSKTLVAALLARKMHRTRNTFNSYSHRRKENVRKNEDYNSLFLVGHKLLSLLLRQRSMAGKARNERKSSH